MTDFEGILPGVTISWDGTTLGADILREALHVDGAEVLASFVDGGPAFTRPAYGAGESFFWRRWSIHPAGRPSSTT